MSTPLPPNDSRNLRLFIKDSTPLPPSYKPHPQSDGSSPVILDFQTNEKPSYSFKSTTNSFPIQDQKNRRLGNITFEILKPEDSKPETPGIITQVTTHTLNSENQCIKNVYPQIRLTNDNQPIVPELVDKKFCE